MCAFWLAGFQVAAAWEAAPPEEPSYLCLQPDGGKTSFWFSLKTIGKAYGDLYGRRQKFRDGLFCCMPTRGFGSDYALHLVGSRHLVRCEALLRDSAAPNSYDEPD